MKNILPLIQDYECFSLFFAGELYKSGVCDKKKLIKDVRFQERAIKNLETFLKANSFTFENIEAWFDINFCILNFTKTRGAFTIKKQPKSWKNVVYLKDARNVKNACAIMSPKFSCKNKNACNNCHQIEKCEIFLVDDFSHREQWKALESLRKVNVQTFSEAVKLVLNRDVDYEILTRKRIPYLEKKYSIVMILYEGVEEMKITRRKLNFDIDQNKDTPVFHIYKDRFSSEPNEIIENFTLITNRLAIPKTYVCSIQSNCRAAFSRLNNLQRHEKICLKDKETVAIRQRVYGPNENVFQEMKSAGFIETEMNEPEVQLIADFDIGNI